MSKDTFDYARSVIEKEIAGRIMDNLILQGDRALGRVPELSGLINRKPTPHNTIELIKANQPLP